MDKKQFFKGISHLPPFDQYITTRIQNLLRDGFEVSTPNIVAIAKGEIDAASPAVQVRAHNNIGRYAMGTKNRVLVLENREWLSVIMKATSEFFDDRDKMIAWMEVVFAAIQMKN